MTFGVLCVVSLLYCVFVLSPGRTQCVSHSCGMI